MRLRGDVRASLLWAAEIRGWGHGPEAYKGQERKSDKENIISGKIVEKRFFVRPCQGRYKYSIKVKV